MRVSEELQEWQPSKLRINTKNRHQFRFVGSWKVLDQGWSPILSKNSIWSEGRYLKRVSSQLLMRCHHMWWASWQEVITQNEHPREPLTLVETLDKGMAVCSRRQRCCLKLRLLSVKTLNHAGTLPRKSITRHDRLNVLSGIGFPSLNNSKRGVWSTLISNCLPKTYGIWWLQKW